MDSKTMIQRLAAIFLVSTLVVPPLVFGGYESARRITTTDVVDHQNNFLLIEDNGEQWLIHHKTGCGSVQEGDELTLVTRGELDGVRDELWKGNYYHCVVDQAEAITGTLRVTTISAAKTYTSVSDQGKPYRIYYNERCAAIRNMKGKDVYVRKYGGNTLQAGDKFFLPGAGEMCTISYVQSELVTYADPEESEIDIKRPTTPTHLRAIPSNHAVYLYWDAAEDESGIAYYVISASLYHRDDPVAQDPSQKPQNMPDTFKTSNNKTSLRIDDLEPDELYFFRVIAVDQAGNESSYWSEEASAMTRSSIAEISLENETLRLFQTQETPNSFLFRWNRLPGSKYSVALEVDNERVFAESEWTKNYIRIFKKPERQGKKLELIVRSLNNRGISQKAVAEFTF